VYRTKVSNIDDLKHRITEAIATADAQILEKTWAEIEYRLDVLRATKGAHVELY
jgi:hypothetical protein